MLASIVPGNEQVLKNTFCNIRKEIKFYIIKQMTKKTDRI